MAIERDIDKIKTNIIKEYNKNNNNNKNNKDLKEENENNNNNNNNNTDEDNEEDISKHNNNNTLHLNIKNKIPIVCSLLLSPVSNACFDDSSNFIIYPSLLGLKGF